ncbi:MAG: 16S rRNA (guanine(966)-N(2))-methyltransferase RsmD [Clostridia bacterium]|nr:16S rRNA (guanine(966)-N(2))-methyltransferase RsmD [Clostridia bacterium]MBQ8400087.1 16S rRNA (guanine(966)-N(2))-methyltransferase RsmD [Clostridia bacterium]
MRIITGSARGAKLQTLDGLDTRPTAERVKEAVFSMIQFEIDGKRVLDLFAGSGQMGLEALSRGAAKATFVDLNQEAAAIVKSNAKKTGLFERSVVLSTDYKSFIRGNGGKNKYDVVFLDPPYNSDFVQDAIERLLRADMLEEGCVIVCESDRKEPFEVQGLTLRRHARYGKVFVTLLEKPTQSTEDEQ